MTVNFEKQSHNVALQLGVILLCSFLAGPACLVVRAEDNPDQASTMLDGLKKRSATERWQRMKKQYPAVSAQQGRNTPSQIPNESIQAADELPPAPQGGLIPRLTSIPRDSSGDWIFPARELPQEVADESANLPPVPSPTVEIQPRGRMAVARAEEATNSATTNDKAEVETPAGTTKTSLERKIDKVIPFYDRDRDRDMRDYASDKWKEFDFSSKNQPYTGRAFPGIDLAWEPSNQYAYPLYFNDPALERYGHTYHPLIQPVASIARLGVQFAFLPYQMTINPPCKKEYALGWYRPGECAPKLHYPIPLNAEAALVEAGAVTGLFFIIP